MVPKYRASRRAVSAVTGAIAAGPALCRRLPTGAMTPAVAVPAGAGLFDGPSSDETGSPACCAGEPVGRASFVVRAQLRPGVGDATASIVRDRTFVLSVDGSVAAPKEDVLFIMVGSVVLPG